MALFAPDTIFLNPAAGKRWHRKRQKHAAAGGLQLRDAAVAGTVTATGAPLAVMDIGGRAGSLRPRKASFAYRRASARRARTRRLRALAAMPAGVVAAKPADAAQRVEQPVARLPRQSHGAGAGGALHRSLPRVFGAVAERRSARAAVRAAGRAGTDVAGSDSAWCWPSRVARRGRKHRRASRWAPAWRSWRLRVLGGDLGGGYFAGVAPDLQWNSAAAAGLRFARYSRCRCRRMAACARSGAAAAGANAQGPGQRPASARGATRSAC